MTPDAPRPDLDDAERWVRQRADPVNGTGYGKAVLAVLLAEYDRRGAALAELDAEIARLRAAMRAAWEDLEPPAMPNKARARMHDALAAAPAPAEDEAHDPADEGDDRD